MTDTTHSIGDAGLQRLARNTTGPVHRPGGGGYDRARTGYQLLAPHRPSAVVEASGAADVQAAVRAAVADAPVAVQATGHGRAAALQGGVLQGGVLVSTAGMDRVDVDADAATARAEAGATWAKWWRRPPCTGWLRCREACPASVRSPTPWAAVWDCSPGAAGSPSTGCGARRW
ncbi:FAD-binding protein [Streptomonospora salina]|uniref:FAD-binding protein n=1 Tax=Streptomonospora salina TaxID=104205 RepID=UPI001FE62E7F|nr:FAD-binding protein [Streptomonospora salina]